MLEDLLILRTLAPKLYRGLRLVLGLLFWLTVGVLGLGLIIEVASSPQGRVPDKQLQQKRPR